MSGATVTNVRYSFFIDYDGGRAVDLGKVDIWLRSPDGKQVRVYDNADGLWRLDTDDNNDSDGGNDYDISFWGTDSKSDISFFMDGNQVNGTWKLVVENDTGKTLTNHHLNVWVDYDAPADLEVKDIKILGAQDVGQPVAIQTWIENVGDKYYLSPVTIEYLVEGSVVGTSYLPLGLPAGQTNLESQLHIFDKIGDNEITVRIKNGNDVTTSNNSRTETFTFDHNEPDLKVTDVKILGTGGVDTPHFITADVQNIGNATYWDDILLEYLVDGEVIGTQTIGIAGLLSGLIVGAENSETELFNFPEAGLKDVTVRIKNSDDWDTSNDAFTTTYQVGLPDLEVTDIRVRDGWEKDDTVTIQAYIENVGYGPWNPLTSSSKIDYYISYEGVAGEEHIGSDTLLLGLLPDTGDWETITHTLSHDGPFTIRTELGGSVTERDTSNNSRSETFANDRSGDPQKTLANSGADVDLAILMARTVYGEEGIPEAFHGTEVNGLQDDYSSYLDGLGWTVLTASDFGELYRPIDGLSKFWSGGLYSGDQGLASSNAANWQAQGLVSTGIGDDGKQTLTLTFRGTDSKDLLEAATGQSFTGDGIYDYYQSMRPLIDAALGYANDASNGIQKVVVSGHSLGGATADLFSLVDGHRLSKDVDLTVVSFASPGLDENALTDSPLFKGMDGQFAPGYFNGSTVTAPPFHIGIAHSIDGVTYSEANPFSLTSGYIPNFVLDSNLDLDNAAHVIHTPNVDNTDFPIATFGAGHNGGLYWANVHQLAIDPLFANYTDERIMVGNSDYETAPDYDGAPFGVFSNYDGYGQTANDNDNGGKALLGGSGRDFILGFSGNDDINGAENDDLLSGGEGNDTLKGAQGNDRIDGGDDNDLLSGGLGADTVAGGDGDDNIFGNGDADLLDGGAGGDQISAGTGDDTVHGGDGDDVILGQGGADIMSGDAGADTLRGGSGNDTVSGGSGNDELYGNGNHDSLDGGEGDDLLQGAGGFDTLLGGAGNDTLTGGEGRDTLDGGHGNDILNGGSEKDVFRFASGSENDRINGFEQGIDTIELYADLWTGTLSGQEIVDSFGNLNATGTILSFDFGGTDILEVQSGSGINLLTFADDLMIA